MSSKTKRLPKRQAKKPLGLPIDELFSYWVDISKRRTLTPADFSVFLEKTTQTLDHFCEFYGWYRFKHIEMHGDKFFRGASSLAFWREQIARRFEGKDRLDNATYAMMKSHAAKFVTRIKKCFAQDLEFLKIKKTAAQDAQDLISTSDKLTYRWAAGIVISNHIAALLIQLSNFKKGEKFTDDIDKLYANLKNRTDDQKLRRFLTKSYRRFEDADKTRNRCAHVNEGEPTVQEIGQSISLSRLLQRFVR